MKNDINELFENDYIQYSASETNHTDDAINFDEPRVSNLADIHELESEKQTIKITSESENELLEKIKQQEEFIAFINGNHIELYENFVNLKEECIDLKKKLLEQEEQLKTFNNKDVHLTHQFSSLHSANNLLDPQKVEIIEVASTGEVQVYDEFFEETRDYRVVDKKVNLSQQSLTIFPRVSEDSYAEIECQKILANELLMPTKEYLIHLLKMLKAYPGNEHLNTAKFESQTLAQHSDHQYVKLVNKYSAMLVLHDTLTNDKAVPLAYQRVISFYTQLNDFSHLFSAHRDSVGKRVVGGFLIGFGVLITGVLPGLAGLGFLSWTLKKDPLICFGGASQGKQFVNQSNYKIEELIKNNTLFSVEQKTPFNIDVPVEAQSQIATQV